MPAIVTVTLNPAIDKSASVPLLIAEKKLRCTAPVFEPGGGGINVARAIHKLGGEATAVYLAGGHSGRAFTDLLDHESVPSIVIETTGRTRENFIVLETGSDQQYRFGMPGPEIQEAEWQRCLQVLEEIPDAEFLVASGSIPPGVPPDIYARIALIGKKKKAKVIVDTSGEPLRLAVQEGVYLIKPNLGELSRLAGKEELNIESVDAVAREIMQWGHCKAIVVSMGAAGAILVTADDVKQVVPPAVKRKSTVGAGDSMVAGIVLGLVQKRALAEAVQYGVACGTAATMNAGTGLCKPEDVGKLFALIRGMDKD